MPTENDINRAIDAAVHLTIAGCAVGTVVGWRFAIGWWRY